jgi:hypothetical protein
MSCEGREVEEISPFLLHPLPKINSYLLSPGVGGIGSLLVTGF